MIVIEVIPFKTFKERLQLVKEYERKGKIEVYSDYVYIEMHEKERATDELYKRGGRVFKKLL
ncbi:hypothetical protein [Clostridium beijerinckii]|nr:hypothetical protein [Clostridium beijerinckii]MZK54125.1 hypothetical protein [Clostridium beijerinckii]MZK54143.1 hypothetical protein [Clostridium beijerinckii]MZK62208.1 hypothetical protein [Clostridium beijerinckii]MZK62213.1 hypothetical protein [Clostridium beijerinckii]MZK72423.1 hypothetical protein [Clostridium beijerinckii]